MSAPRFLNTRLTPPRAVQFGSILIASTLVLSACSQEPAGPWAKTELSRIALESKASSIEDPKALANELQRYAKKPNLYDLHHHEGALAKLSPKDLFATALILENAGFPLELDDETGAATVRGKKRHLWYSRNTTPVERPFTVNRFPYPARPGLIVVATDGVIRVTEGDEYPGLLNGPEELPSFVEQWNRQVDVTPPQPSASRLIEADAKLPLVVGADGSLTLRGQEVKLELLSKRLQKILAKSPGPVFIQPHPQSTYGQLVQVLDRLFTVSEDGTPVRYALPHRRLSQAGEPVGVIRRLRPKPSESRVLALVIDESTPFETVQKILDTVAEGQDRVLFQTRLDLKDKSRIDANTWPGGLFGGLLVSLASPTEEQLARFAGPTPSGADGDATSSPSTQPGDILNVGGDVQPPVKLSSAEPAYTASARKARIEGVVILQVVIDTEGRVESTKVLKGLPMGLNERAQEAALQWTFEPATQHGQPVKVLYNMTVQFRL